MTGGAKKIGEKFIACVPCSSSSRTRIPKQVELPPPPPDRMKPHPPIPAGFLCPVSSLLMFDPTIIDSGDSLDLHCLQACKEVEFIPSNHNLPLPSFPLTPNHNLASAIQEWCDTYGHPIPTLISQESARHFLRGLQSLPNPPPPPLPRPPFMFDPEVEEKFFNYLQEDLDLGLVTLLGTPLCSARILGVLVPLLISPEPNVQIQAANVIYSFCNVHNNKTHILRSGAVSHLITMLNRNEQDAWVPAADALNNLATDAPYYCLLTIGALGAIKPLLDRFTQSQTGGLVAAGLALYQLSLHCQTNAEVLVEIGGVEKLMEMARDETSVRVLRMEALRILKCLVGVERGREKLMEGGNIGVLLRFVKEGEGLGFQSLNVMHNLCTENLERFREVAVALRGEEVLAHEMEDWGEDGKVMAIHMLEVIRGGSIEGEQLDDDEITLA